MSTTLTTPETAPETTQSGDGALATITGCTSSCTYTIDLQSDGSALTTTFGTGHALVMKQNFPAGTIDSKRLLSLLAPIGDVVKIPTAEMEITYAGKKSGNLHSIPSHAPKVDEALLKASKKLAKFLDKVLSELKIS